MSSCKNQHVKTNIMEQQNKKVVVFGATGNLGAYVSMKLKEDGYDVVAAGGRKSDNGFFADHGMSYYSVGIKNYVSFGVLDAVGEVK